MTKGLILLFLLIGPVCHAQSVTIDWTNVHQVIDGFGANDYNESGTNNPTSALFTPAQAAILFGTGPGQLGLTILRTGVPDNGTGYSMGDCTSVSANCAGIYLPDYQLVMNNYPDVRMYITPFSPPAIYKTINSPLCNNDGNTLATAHYQDFANWITNFIKSVQVNANARVVAAVMAGEPEFCLPTSGPGATYSPWQIATFIQNNLGPTFASNGLSSVLILAPATSYYSDMSAYGYVCATTPACSNYLGGFAHSGYQDHLTLPDTVDAGPLPAGWTSAGGRYWLGEISCFSGGGGPSWCTADWGNTIANALGYAADIDQRLAGDNMNAYNFWWFMMPASTGIGEALLDQTTNTPALRGYVFGQYSRFVRPGYFRIDATHKPQAGVSVSAYQNTTGGNLAIVATNYTSSPITQTFNVVNAPTFTSVMPYITSATQNIQAQATQSVSSNSFTYTLPADSVTTFVGTSSGSTGPVPPTKLQAVVN